MLNRTLISLLLSIVIVTTSYSQETIDGYVVTLQGDTLRGKLVKAAKTRDERRLAFSEVTLINSEGQSKRYVPGEIKAYVKGSASFRNFADGDKHVFAEQLTRGRVWLYFSSGGDGTQSRYFFKRNHETDFMVMNADAPAPRRLGASAQAADRTDGDGSDILIMPDRDKAFKEYFSAYFKDCVRISRKITMDFYSRSDIKDIFIEYNAECK